MKRSIRLKIIFAAGALVAYLSACSEPPPLSSSPGTTEASAAKAEVESSKDTPTIPVDESVGADWPQWRGPRQDGISLETGLLTEWPEGGPPELWRLKMGKGYSSLAVVGDRAYTMFGDDEGEYVVCINVTNGQTVWQVTSAGPYKNSYGDGPRATPTVHEGRVYIVGATGAVLCLDAGTGDEIWALNVLRTFKGENLEWGLSASPVIFNEKVIVVANGNEGSSLAALDKNTGKTIWTSLDDKAGYSTPLIIELDNKKQLVVVTGEAAVGVAPDDGRELWRYPWETNLDVNAATPIFHNNRLFISSGYDTGSALLELVVNEGQVEPKLLWESKKMKNFFSSSILIDGFLYGFHNAIFTCMDFKTGEVQWTQRGFYRGSLLSVDGRLIIFSERGTLALAEISSEAFMEISSVKVLDGNKTWTIPTLSRGRLFVRNDEELVCLNLKP